MIAFARPSGTGTRWIPEGHSCPARSTCFCLSSALLTVESFAFPNEFDPSRFGVPRSCFPPRPSEPALSEAEGSSAVNPT